MGALKRGLSTMKIDRDKVAGFIRDVAVEKIIPRFRALEEGDIKEKSSPTDLVTIADIEAEIELTRILKDYLPGSEVVGEEAVSSDRISRDILSSHSRPVWIVDPVDGTGNFARGEEVFGTMVALVDNGERVASWIYQIPTNRMVAAEKGAGVTVDGNALDLSAIKRAFAADDYSTMRAFVSRKFMPPSVRPYVDEMVAKMADASTFMCCAWEYVKVLEGEASFSIYKRIEPWDHMAGVLFLEEAGFYIRKWDGGIYTADDVTGGLVNAPSEELWHRVHTDFVAMPLKLASKA
jgi:fructose-1,6-bisphosphatase/inositol monophosphatase family enzyme